MASMLMAAKYAKHMNNTTNKSWNISPSINPMAKDFWSSINLKTLSVSPTVDISETNSVNGLKTFYKENHCYEL